MLDSGMLWYDNHIDLPLKERIQQAADYYEQKYGQRPSICYVPQNELDQETSLTSGIAVHPAKEILPNHLWIGCL